MKGSKRITRSHILASALAASACASALSQDGSWSPASGWTIDNDISGIEAIHMIHLHTGQFMVWDANYSAHDATHWRYYTPPSSGNPFGVLSALQTLSDTNAFCSGHAHLDDGSVLTAGGHEGHDGVLAGDGLDDYNLITPQSGAAMFSTCNMNVGIQRAHSCLIDESS